MVYKNILNNSQIIKGHIFDVKKFSTDDGPGIRTTVFFKGCPLCCLWCHSPESIKQKKELLFFETKCIKCGRCVEACPNEAQIITEKDRWIDREKCKVCGRCAEVCPVEALKIIPQDYTVEEVVDIIMEDKVFYNNSDGGVTFSGGEPTLQYDFLLEVIKSCKSNGIHVAIDTTGYIEWHKLEKLSKFTDLFLYDLKHVDPYKHKEYTGVSNMVIIDNLKKLSNKNSHIWVRVPMIPGYNTDDNNFSELASLLSTLNIDKVSLLPFNLYAGSKYKWLDLDYPLEGLKDISEERKMQLKKILEKENLSVEIQ